MKKKIYNILKILFLLSVMLVALTACGEKEEKNESPKVKYESDANVSELVLKEIENGTFKFINNDTIESFCNENELKITPDEVSGILAIAIQDFDNDNQEEVVSITIDDNKDIYLELYMPQGNKLVKADVYKISDALLKYSDKIDFSVFVKEEDNKLSLYYESQGITSIFADGTSWNFGKLNIENGRILEKVHKNYEGSMIDEETEKELVETVKDSGLDVEEIDFIGRNIVFQLEDIVEICNISRTHTDEYDSNTADKTKLNNVRYGHTIYLNLVNSNDYRLNLEIPNISKEIEKTSYDMNLGFEKATVEFENEKDITAGIIALEKGTYKVLGNRILAIYTSAQDPSTEDYIRINHEKHYRILDNKLIDETDVYIKSN